MWEVIGIIALFIVTASSFYYIGHEAGYRHGQAAMVNELNKFMEQAKLETEEVRQQLMDIEDRIDKVSDDLKM